MKNQSMSTLIKEEVFKNRLLIGTPLKEELGNISKSLHSIIDKNRASILCYFLYFNFLRLLSKISLWPWSLTTK